MACTVVAYKVMAYIVYSYRPAFHTHCPGNLLVRNQFWSEMPEAVSAPPDGFSLWYFRALPKALLEVGTLHGKWEVSPLQWLPPLDHPVRPGLLQLRSFNPTEASAARRCTTSLRFQRGQRRSSLHQRKGLGTRDFWSVSTALERTEGGLVQGRQTCTAQIVI